MHTKIIHSWDKVINSRTRKSQVHKGCEKACVWVRGDKMAPMWGSVTVSTFYLNRFFMILLFVALLNLPSNKGCIVHGLRIIPYCLVSKNLWKDSCTVGRATDHFHFSPLFQCSPSSPEYLIVFSSEGPGSSKKRTRKRGCRAGIQVWRCAFQKGISALCCWNCIPYLRSGRLQPVCLRPVFNCDATRGPILAPWSQLHPVCGWDRSPCS